MKKIIHIITISDINHQQPLIRTAVSLSNNGFTVKMVGRKLKNSFPLSEQPFLQKRLNCFFTKKMIGYAEYNIRLFFYLLFKKQDVICAVDLDTALPVLLVSYLKKIKRVYDARELFTEMITVLTRPRIHKAWLMIEKFVIPRFPQGYAVCDSIAEELYKRYKVRYSIIRNISVLKNLPEQKSFLSIEHYILYQGYVHEARGLEQMMMAMHFINMKWVICGTGNIYSQLTRMAEQQGLQDKVVFKGLLPPSELPEITRNAFIGINLMERQGMNQYYSLTNKFFDYIHAGIPQVTMNYPEYKKINDIYNIAVLIDDLETDTIVNAINRLSSNKALYDQLKENCLKARLTLNWQEEEKQLIQFYQQLLS